MAILLNNNGYGNESWLKELPNHLSDMPIYCYPDIPDKAEIKYALVWDHPKGDLLNYPNLEAILSLGAGVEHLVEDPDLPDLPIVRLIDPAVANDMAMHALYWVISFHRHYYVYQGQQNSQHWQRYECKPVDEFSVGILGLGNIGTVVAQKIAKNGYDAYGWDLSDKTIPDVKTFAMQRQLKDFLSGIDVLINCLPLTSETEGMINMSFMKDMKAGSFLINISRGAILNEEDLMVQLDEGHLAGAALDATTLEPLPKTSPLWTHPNIHITPHMSGATYARSAARTLAENIKRLETGQLPTPLYDKVRGY